MIRSQRTDLGRIKAGKCTRHNSPLTPSNYFFGGECKYGCRESTLAREAFVAKSKAGWRRN